jgi:hypothetical protein
MWIGGVIMPYCPKCGSEVGDEMTFCPKCGAPLKGAQAATPTDWRVERRERRRDEKAEKNEKQEKGEKHEKQEHPYIGPVIGGIVLIFLGVVAYLEVLGYHISQYVGPVFLIIIGIVILLFALTRTARRKPRP